MSGGRGKRKGRRIALIAAAALVAVMAVAVAVYASDFSRAGEEAEAAMAGGVLENGAASFGDRSGRIGLIFYPGGKVEYTAYAPLLRRLAENGVFAAVPHMPLNLAVLDSGAAERIMEQNAGIETWFIGGHSLGGAMAAAYAAEHPEAFSGVILLAAYATKPLERPALSLLGSNDTVLDREAYESYRENLAGGLTERTLEGGNHAQFGDYGPQAGDSPAAVSPEEQWDWTAEAVLEFISENNQGNH